MVMALLAVLFGRPASLIGGLALAVLPSAVVTARSDTMDSVMAALCVAGAVVAVRSGRRGRAGGVAVAGAVGARGWDGRRRGVGGVGVRRQARGVAPRRDGGRRLLARLLTARCGAVAR